MESTIIELLTNRLGISRKGVMNTVKLLQEGATVPFISRYRKEMTGSLDEIQVLDIKNELQKIEELIKRKETILKAISEQGLMTPAIRKKIEETWDATSLEDIYLPFKKKQKTKATIARDQGLEPLAKIIMAQREANIISLAKKFVNKQVLSIDQALEGSRYIMAEWINENSTCREIVRDQFARYAVLVSKVIKSKKTEAKKFEIYFDFEQPLNKIPSHRTLAIYRGEKEGYLRSKIEIEKEYVQKKFERYYIKDNRSDSAEQISMAIEDALKRLLLPSIENEYKKISKQKADKEAIEVFIKNLKDLLLAPPLGSKRMLALDPGYRTGCKIVALNEQGDLLDNDTIYPHPPQSKKVEAEDKILRWIQKYKIESIAIGNGTAGKESLHWINSLASSKDLLVFSVNENGASIYSASAVAREEFPDKDITVRGAVSIGRRLMDPLAELVKIDPKSIGVGQYQHDVNQKQLKESLEDTVVSCVNRVGINLNTASKHLLSHVSGLGPVLAKNIVEYRKENGPFKERKQLLKVARMGNKAFEQCAGFLRIKDGTNPLDNTAVHPERYKLVKKMAKDLKVNIEELIHDKSIQASIDLNKYTDEKVGMPTLRDIQDELNKPGLDPRGSAKAVQFSNQINKISDLSVGLILPGLVTNITKFGAFLDIGIKASGLVHISEIVNRYISDPAEVLSVGQEVKVKVIAIDEERERVSLSIKQAT